MSRLFAIVVTLVLPLLVFAQEQIPTANAPEGVPQVVAPHPAPDTVAGPGKDLQSERKAIFDRMQECMKDAQTNEQKKACRDEMRKSRAAINEAKKENPPQTK